MKVAGKDYGRVAFRHEGLEWIAYYAKTDTMDGAQRLCAINYNLINVNPRIRDLFIELAKEVVNDVIREVSGEELDWRRPSKPSEQERFDH